MLKLLVYILFVIFSLLVFPVLTSRLFVQTINGSTIVLENGQSKLPVAFFSPIKVFDAGKESILMKTVANRTTCWKNSEQKEVKCCNLNDPDGHNSCWLQNFTISIEPNSNLILDEKHQLWYVHSTDNRESIHFCVKNFSRCHRSSVFDGRKFETLKIHAWNLVESELIYSRDVSDQDESFRELVLSRIDGEKSVVLARYLPEVTAADVDHLTRTVYWVDRYPEHHFGTMYVRLSSVAMDGSRRTTLKVMTHDRRWDEPRSRDLLAASHDTVMFLWRNKEMHELLVLNRGYNGWNETTVSNFTHISNGTFNLAVENIASLYFASEDDMTADVRSKCLDDQSACEDLCLPVFESNYFKAVCSCTPGYIPVNNYYFRDWCVPKTYVLMAKNDRDSRESRLEILELPSNKTIELWKSTSTHVVDPGATIKSSNYYWDNKEEKYVIVFHIFYEDQIRAIEDNLVIADLTNGNILTSNRLLKSYKNGNKLISFCLDRQNRIIYTLTSHANGSFGIFSISIDEPSEQALLISSDNHADYLMAPEQIFLSRDWIVWSDTRWSLGAVGVVTLKGHLLRSVSEKITRLLQMYSPHAPKHWLEVDKSQLLWFQPVVSTGRTISNNNRSDHLLITDEQRAAMRVITYGGDTIYSSSSVVRSINHTMDAVTGTDWYRHHVYWSNNGSVYRVLYVAANFDPDIVELHSDPKSDIVDVSVMWAPKMEMDDI